MVSYSVADIALGKTHMDQVFGWSRDVPLLDANGIPFEFAVRGDVVMMRGLGQDGVRRTGDDYYAVMADYVEGIRVLNPAFRKSPFRREFGIRK